MTLKKTCDHWRAAATGIPHPKKPNFAFVVLKFVSKLSEQIVLKIVELTLNFKFTPK